VDQTGCDRSGLVWCPAVSGTVGNVYACDKCPYRMLMLQATLQELSSGLIRINLLWRWWLLDAQNVDMSWV